jgi:hypothetical protein
MAEDWRIVGDFIDFCRCDVPCRCTFGQPPDEDHCEGVIGYRIREGHYGDVRLDGLNLIGVASFDGNIWEEDTRATMGMILDERADDAQREALQTIFGGQAGGWPQMFAENFVGEVTGIEFAPIDLQISDDLSSWRVEVPGKITAASELLTGPTSTPGKRIAVINAPGAEVGPGQGAVTYATATANEVNAVGFRFEWPGKSSKHIPFEWSSEDKF